MSRAMPVSRGRLVASSETEVAQIIVESVIKSALYSVVQEKLAQYKWKSGNSTADFVVYEVLLRGLAKYLSEVNICRLLFATPRRRLHDVDIVSQKITHDLLRYAVDRFEHDASISRNFHLHEDDLENPHDYLESEYLAEHGRGVFTMAAKSQFNHEQVEGSSFNLFRRLSENDTNFEEDELHLLNMSGKKTETSRVKPTFNHSGHKTQDKKKAQQPKSQRKGGVRFGSTSTKPAEKHCKSIVAREDTNSSMNSLENAAASSSIINPVSLKEENEPDAQQNHSDLVTGSSGSGGDDKFTGTKEVNIAGKLYSLEMSLVQPYSTVFCHGGHFSDPKQSGARTAVIAIFGCCLPEKSIHGYDRVMNQLLIYLMYQIGIGTSGNYVIVYFHGGMAKHQAPKFGWLRNGYQMVDRKFRKNLKHLYLVHPTFWVKTMLFFSRPFISKKFSSKVKYLASLKELDNYLLPRENLHLPEKVVLHDQHNSTKKTK